MLTKNNLYILLLVSICTINFGCSLVNGYKMNPMETGDPGDPSSSRGGRSIHPAPEDDVTIMCQTINNFLDTGNFEKGSVLSDNEIDLILQNLHKKINRSDLKGVYTQFLNLFGSVYGEGLNVVGPAKDFDDKIKYISSFQLGFENRCKNKHMSQSKVKSLWLIGYRDQGDEYYIDCSKNGKGYIYSINTDGESKFFAKNFLDFLNNFFQSYEVQKEKDTSEDSFSQEDLYLKLDRFSKTGAFKKGEAIDNNDLNLVMQQLGKNIDILDFSDEYSDFLSEFGSIRSESSFICGPTKGSTNKVEDMLSLQREFEAFLERIDWGLEANKKHIWLIAKNNQGNQYFISNAENSNAHSIYCIDSSGKCLLFANNFLDFLDKFFEEYRLSTQR